MLVAPETWEALHHLLGWALECVKFEVVYVFPLARVAVGSVGPLSISFYQKNFRDRRVF